MILYIMVICIIKYNKDIDIIFVIRWSHMSQSHVTEKKVLE